MVESASEPDLESALHDSGLDKVLRNDLGVIEHQYVLHLISFTSKFVKDATENKAYIDTMREKRNAARSKGDQDLYRQLVLQEA
jgi:hypothetical protein